MQRVTINISSQSAFSPSDGFRVFANADQSGVVLAAIDYGRAIGGNSVRLFHPFGQQTSVWGETAWGAGSWGGQTPIAEPIAVQSQLLYFGWYRFIVKTYDAIGNATPAATEFRSFVNSGPQGVSNFKQTAVEDGRPVFSFTPPPQIR